MDNKDVNDIDVVLNGDYKRRSSKSFLAIGTILVIVAILLYPKLQSYLSADTPKLNLRVVLPWTMFTFVIIVLLSAIPIVLRRISKIKEAEILKAREQAELLCKYHEELDGSDVMEDYYELEFAPPKPGERFPTYRPPVNATNDPFTAKPKGFAAQQAQQGYPQAPALQHLIEPTDPAFKLPEQESSEQFYEFKRAMAVHGVTGSEAVLLNKFQQYKQFQKMQAQTLGQAQAPTKQAGLFTHSEGFPTNVKGFSGYVSN